jgi:hypothetical protein
MIIKEIAASLYPWDLADEGIESCAKNLMERSDVNSIYLVGVMHHEKRPLTSLFYTHNPVRKYYIPENSRVYYKMDLNNFKNTKLKPNFSEREFLKDTDWLDVLTKHARAKGLKAGIELSHTIFDTQIAAKEHPDIMQRDIHNGIIHRMICPNNPDVHEYMRVMFYDSVLNHDVDFIQTCLMLFDTGKSVNAPWFFKEWMETNDESNKLAALLGLATGGCFCDACKARAKAKGFDWDLILKDMKELNSIARGTAYESQDGMMNNHLTMGSNLMESALLVEYPGLYEFLRFRIDSINELFKDIYGSVHEAKAGIDLRYNNYMRFPELAGLSYKHVAPYLDSVRDSDYTEQLQRKFDNFVYKRNTLLKIRRGIGFDKDLIAAFAVRPNATPELLREMIAVLATMGVDGFSLGHYDCAHMEHLDAVKQGMKEANVVLKGV